MNGSRKVRGGICSALAVIGGLTACANAGQTTNAGSPGDPGSVGEHVAQNWDKASPTEIETSIVRARADGQLVFEPFFPNLGIQPAHIWVVDPNIVSDPAGRDLEVSYVFDASAPGFLGDGRVLLTERPLGPRTAATAAQMARTAPAGTGHVLAVSGRQVAVRLSHAPNGTVTATAEFALGDKWVIIAGPAITEMELTKLLQIVAAG